MSDTPVQIIVAVFQDERGADTLVYQLEAAKSAGYIGIHNVAVLRRDEKNKLHIREKGDWGPGKGAAAGAAIGATVGLLAGPGAIVVGAAGAVIGGLAAKLRDSGFPDERLKKLGESLTPRTSALVVVVESKEAGELEKKLTEAGGEVTAEEMAAQIADLLVLDGEVLYTATGTEESVIAAGGTDPSAGN